MLRVLILVCTLAFWLAPNPVPSAAADPCPGARPISEVRKLPVNSQATVRGFVTVPTGALTDGKSFAVQDAGSIAAGMASTSTAARGSGKSWRPATTSA